jgi:hypothetical protein
LDLYPDEATEEVNRMTRAKNPAQPTTNPAGAHMKLTELRPTYNRENFMSDLKKVARKVEPKK